MKKLKNLKISEELHKKIKIHCAINSINIINFIEEVLKKELDKNDNR